MSTSTSAQQQQQQQPSNNRSNSPFSRIMSVFRRSNEEERGRSFRFMRPQRPTRTGNGNGNVDLIANLEGNRAFQSSKSFVTQGVILPVNIDKSSLSVVKRSELELEITGKADCNVPCQISSQCDSWKQKYFGSSLQEGLGQEFSIIVPNFASFGPKAVELIISEDSAESQASKYNKAGKFANPFYVSEQFTKISLSRNENGTILLKAEDQYINLRNKNFSLLEIFGKPLTSIRSAASSPTSYCSDGLSNRECIVCMSEVKDTIVLPCRHMCLCSECADTIRGRSDKCPLCRQGKNRKLCDLIINYFRIPCFITCQIHSSITSIINNFFITKFG